MGNTVDTSKQVLQFLQNKPQLDYEGAVSLYNEYYFYKSHEEEAKAIVQFLEEEYKAYVDRFWEQTVVPEGEKVQEQEDEKTSASDLVAASKCEIVMNNNYRSKKYYYEWEDFEDTERDAKTLLKEILSDPKLPELEEIIIGCWGECYDNSAQPIINGIVAHKEAFGHIKSLFVGDMEMEECEVSWIEQADYSKLWEALPQLEKLTIKGSQELQLGEIHHEHLKELEIICGGLPQNVLQSLIQAELPNLTELTLYIGIEDYGFDGSLQDICDLLAKPLPKVTKLALLDSEIQDEIVDVLMKSDYMKQVTELSLGMGSLSDVGGKLLLEEVPKHSNIVLLDLEYHYMSDEMMEKLKQLPIEVNVEDQQDDDEFNGRIYRYPMLTE